MTISEFISKLDVSWQNDGPEKIVLKLIGSAALMLQTNYARVTKDADILQVEPLTPEICDRLEKLAGRGSKLDRRHNMYLEFVSPGLPFLPRTPNWRDLPELGQLQHFRLHTLDVVDVVVSKLARYNANDVQDIDAMITQGLVPYQLLIERFRAAVDGYEMDARAERLPGTSLACTRSNATISVSARRRSRSPLGSPRNDPELGSPLATPVFC
jgi:Nucleotidyltransferase of unknown function (DUF6036)